MQDKHIDDFEPGELRRAVIELAFTPDQQEGANAIRFYETLDRYVESEITAVLERLIEKYYAYPIVDLDSGTKDTVLAVPIEAIQAELDKLKGES